MSIQGAAQQATAAAHLIARKNLKVSAKSRVMRSAVVAKATHRYAANATRQKKNSKAGAGPTTVAGAQQGKTPRQIQIRHPGTRNDAVMEQHAGATGLGITSRPARALLATEIATVTAIAVQ